MTSCDVTCPVITFSTDSELADVGESCVTAELPQPSDWLPAIESSSALANDGCDLLTVQLLDVNDNCVTLQRQTYSDLAELDGTLTSDDDLSDDVMRQGRHLICAFSLFFSV